MNAKRKETSPEIRKLVINLYIERGKSIRKTAETVNLSHSTVFNIIKRYKKNHMIQDKRRLGRPSKLSNGIKRIIVRNIKKNPRKSAPKVAADLQALYGIIVNPETIRRVIRSAGYHGRAARKKFFVSEKNRKLRLAFAKSNINKNSDYWNKVIFADESKFNIFGSDGRILVWRKPREEFRKQNLVPTVKHGGGGVMVWGCMSSAGVGNLVFIDGIMDQYKYIDILKQNLKSSARKCNLHNDFKFYQDNDPKHTALNVRLWLLYNCPEIIKTPPQSPDLNPIENIWQELESRIRKHTISSKQQLKSVLQEEWGKITPEITKKLVESIPRRLNHVLKVKGNPTKY